MKNETRQPRPPQTGPGQARGRKELVDEFKTRSGLSVAEEDLSGDTAERPATPLLSLPFPEEDGAHLFHPEDYSVTEEQAIRHHFDLYWQWDKAERAVPVQGMTVDDAQARCRRWKGWLTSLRQAAEQLESELKSSCGLDLEGAPVGEAAVECPPGGEPGDAAPPNGHRRRIAMARQATTNRDLWDRSVREVARVVPHPADGSDPIVDAMWTRLFVDLCVPDESPVAEKYRLFCHLRASIPVLSAQAENASRVADQLHRFPNRGGAPKDPDLPGRRALIRRLACVRKGPFAGKIPAEDVLRGGKRLGWPELPSLTGPRMNLPLHDPACPDELLLKRGGRVVTREDLFIHFILSCKDNGRVVRGAFLEPADIALLLQASRIEPPSADPAEVQQTVKDDLKWIRSRLSPKKAAQARKKQTNR